MQDQAWASIGNQQALPLPFIGAALAFEPHWTADLAASIDVCEGEIAPVLHGNRYSEVMRVALQAAKCHFDIEN
jgi:hypothetical protein